MLYPNSIHESHKGTEIKLVHTIQKINRELNRKPKNHHQNSNIDVYIYTQNHSNKRLKIVLKKKHSSIKMNKIFLKKAILGQNNAKLASEQSLSSGNKTKTSAEAPHAEKKIKKIN